MRDYLDTSTRVNKDEKAKGNPHAGEALAPRIKSDTNSSGKDKGAQADHVRRLKDFDKPKEDTKEERRKLPYTATPSHVY